MSVDKIGETPAVNDSSYKDVSFSVLFAANALVVLGLCMSYGVAALRAPEPSKVIIESNGHRVDDSNNESDKTTFLWGVLVITSLAAVLSVIWVFVIARMASQLVFFTAAAVVAFNVVGALVLFVVGNVIGGAFAVVIAASSFAFFYWIKNRIEFASVNMQTACSAMKDMPSVLLYAYGMMAAMVCPT
jgi:hypothetical protein